jgi:hypothetical protein
MRLTSVVVVACLVLPAYAQNSSPSLADVARQERARRCKESGKFCDQVQSSVDKSWVGKALANQPRTEVTDETVNSAHQPSDREVIEQFRALDRIELGRAVLKMANADVPFPGRADWEWRLFWAKQEWLRQLDRLQGHIGTQSAPEENRLTEKASLTYRQTSGEGSRRAAEYKKDEELKLGRTLK